MPPPDAPDERIEAGDPLHWTGLAQNWNTMCAECHSTDYHKNYDLATQHVPLEVHRNRRELRDVPRPGQPARRAGRAAVAVLGPQRRLRPDQHAEERRRTCSRWKPAPRATRGGRSIHADYRAGDAFYDHFDPSLLHNGLYHADGQIQDEVYEYGSFTQSKMYHKGVQCTDCHDPHSLELKYEGNRLCAQCHQPGKYDGAGAPSSRQRRGRRARDAVRDLPHAHDARTWASTTAATTASACRGPI